MSKIYELELLRDKITGQKCTCQSINDRLEDIEAGMGLVCCAKCCDCHWDRIVDGGY